MKNKVNWVIVVILLVLWLGIMLLFYLKADEVTKDPCGICANKMGDDVTCTVGRGGMIIQRIYYPNYTIENVAP